jgi:hypothetical protein
MVTIRSLAVSPNLTDDTDPTNGVAIAVKVAEELVTLVN